MIARIQSLLSGCCMRDDLQVPVIGKKDGKVVSRRKVVVSSRSELPQCAKPTGIIDNHYSIVRTGSLFGPRLGYIPKRNERFEG